MNLGTDKAEPFMQRWKQLMELSEKVTISGETSEAGEWDRFKTITAYIDELLKSRNLHLLFVPQQTWQDLENEANGTINYIEAFIQNESEDYIKGANDHLGTLLKHIDPYLVIDKEKAKAITVSQIRGAKDKATEILKKIKEQQKSSEKMTSDLKSFHANVYGGKNEEGKIEGGYKQEIEKLIERQKTTFEELRKNIEGLLPGATSAGLASAFQENKVSFDKTIRLNSGLFILSTIVLFFISFSLFSGILSSWLSIGPLDSGDPVNLLAGLIYRLSVLAPLIWLTIFASQRLSEAQRLKQEYAHKEAIAKSYESFKQQIDKLNFDAEGNHLIKTRREPVYEVDENSDAEEDYLIRTLLETSIEAIGFNPSKTLDKKHGDKPPLLGMSGNRGDKEKK